MENHPSVFISYATGDDAEFARLLGKTLANAGIRVWIDENDMPSQGRGLSQELRDAIAESQRLLLVVGPAAAHSEYVQAEWRFAWQIGKVVIPVLRLGDPSMIPRAISHLHYVDARLSRDLGDAIREVTRNCKRPVPPFGALHGVPVPPVTLLERSELLARLKRLAVADSYEPTVVTATGGATSILGMGGVGKSVMAMQVARDPDIRRAFVDGIVWLNVGRQGSLYDLAVRAGTRLGNTRAARATSQDEALVALETHLSNRVCLFVLDDVWALNVAEAFLETLGPRSRMVITTRDRKIAFELASERQRIDVELLSDTEARTLLSLTGEVKRTELPDAAVEVIRHCNGLPLALAMIGALLRHSQVTWDEVAAQLRGAQVEMLAHQLRGYPYGSLIAAFDVSVDALARQLGEDFRQCYLRLAAFPAGTNIPLRLLPAAWGASLGTRSPRQVAAALVDRSLARWIDEDHLTIHDLQGDCCRYVIGAGIVEPHLGIVEYYRELCDREHRPSVNDPRFGAAPVIHLQGGSAVGAARLPFVAYLDKGGPRDGYFHEHLPYHLKHSGELEEFALLLGNSKWLLDCLSYFGDLGIPRFADVLFPAGEGNGNPTLINSLLIKGPPGAGKTTLAAWFLRRVAAMGIRCAYLTNTGEADRIRSTVLDDNADNGALLKIIDRPVTGHDWRLGIDMRRDVEDLDCAIVVIDGLIADAQNREGISTVFEAARKSSTLLVPILEDASVSPMIHGTDMEFMVDVIVELMLVEKNGYVTRKLQIQPGRYTRPIYGVHELRFLPGRHSDGFPRAVIYPSLHAQISATQRERVGHVPDPNSRCLWPDLLDEGIRRESTAPLDSIAMWSKYWDAPVELIADATALRWLVRTENASVLTIVFADPDGYRSARDMAAGELGIAENLDTLSVEQRITEVFFRPGMVGPDRVLFEIVEQAKRIGKANPAGETLVRVCLGGNFRQRFPRLGDDIFFPAVVCCLGVWTDWLVLSVASGTEPPFPAALFSLLEFEPCALAERTRQQTGLPERVFRVRHDLSLVKSRAVLFGHTPTTGEKLRMATVDNSEISLLSNDEG